MSQDVRGRRRIQQPVGQRPTGQRARQPPRPAPRRRDPRRAPPGGRPRGPAAYEQGARQQLRRFRQGSALAVALTAILLLIWAGPLELEGQQPDEPAADPLPELPTDPTAAVDEATATIFDLAYGFYAYLPRLVIVLLLFTIAALVARAMHAVLRRTLREWQRREAVSAIARLVVFLVAIVAALSVLAGDVRAIVGSVGLLGLAASWALQTPIESFTGWLLNSFRTYYRVGDRISVGDVFGDVYRIDVLTTTVWEAGGPGKPVVAAQATGALITFPNWEVLRSNITNYSRFFPYVWDEITINVANESDLQYTKDVLETAARRLLGEEMVLAAQRYQELLAAERLAFDVDEVPHVYFSLADSWTDCTVRYLVPVRTRRRWSSALVLALSQEINKPEHRDRILPVYPRTELVLRRQWPEGHDEA
jgi:small conductance mechanosensitive channel